MEARVCSVCYEPLVAGSLGGAVGCINGHAIHAHCATNLALGGGACALCRQPLYGATMTKEDSLYI